MRAQEYCLDSSGINVVENIELAQKYWNDAEHARGRRASGQTVRREALTLDDVKQDSNEASIFLTDEFSLDFLERCNRLRELFRNIYEGYTKTPYKSLRSFTLFTPKRGRGRSPELHIDNTELTLHWATALATFSVHDGELGEDVWDALSVLKRKTLNPMSEKDKQVLDNQYKWLIELAQNLPMTENEIGDVMITKGQLGKDFEREANRAGVCVHVSSPSIIEFGQVGYLMTPEVYK